MGFKKFKFPKNSKTKLRIQGQFRRPYEIPNNNNGDNFSHCKVFQNFRQFQRVHTSNLSANLSMKVHQAKEISRSQLATRISKNILNHKPKIS